MASIGSAALILSVDSAKLYSGLTGAANFIRSSVAGMVAGVAASLGAFVAASNKTIMSLAKIGREAQTLGVASDVFMGLTQNARKFGIDTETMTHALIKFSAHMEGSGKQTEEFAKKLAGMGIDVRGKSVDQQFLAIADAIKKLPTPAQQAAAAISLFGKQGAELLPVLQQGGAAIEAFIDKQRKMGLLISPKDMQAITAARAEIPRVGILLEGLWNRVVIAMLPVLRLINTGLSGGLAKLAELFKHVGEFATGAGFVAGEVLRQVGQWIVHVAQGLGFLTGVWQSGQGPILDWGDTAITVLGKVGESIAYVRAGFHVLGDTLQIAWAGWRRMAAEAAHAAGLHITDEQYMREVQAAMAMGGRAEHDLNTLDRIRDQMRKSVDEIRQRYRDWKNAVPPTAPKMPDLASNADLQMHAGAIAGSKEAYTVETKFTFGNMVSKSEQQLREQQKANFLLGNINDGVGRMIDAVSNAGLALGVL